MTWLHRVKILWTRFSNSEVYERQICTPPRRSAVWLRGATARPCGDEYWVFWGDHYSVLFHLYARGLHCYAARATR